jgi:GNAT superfamily N-acetyltransferase/RimJ/RimL family protein N-acetyltransferase
MRIERFDPVADTEKIMACHALYEAGHPVDDPAVPMMSLPTFTAWFSMGWTYCPREAWLVPGGKDQIPAAASLLELPVSENRHIGWVSITVAPGERRRGIGSALLRHSAQRAAELGRTVLSAAARDGSAGYAFALAVGARKGIVDVRRVLDLAGIPDGKLESLRRAAEAAAGGYSLLSWRGPCPQEYLDQVAAVTNALADAPHDPGQEPEQVTGLRIRRGELRIAAQGLRYYTVAARHDQTGELAGLTQLGVDPMQPDWGFQELTAVTRAHRGHRLGLLVKVAMLDLLADREPELERILTDNAGANSHMIAINADLGFRVLDQWQGWQLDVTRAAATAAPASASPG